MYTRRKNSPIVEIETLKDYSFYDSKTTKNKIIQLILNNFGSDVRVQYNILGCFSTIIGGIAIEHSMPDFGYDRYYIAGKAKITKPLKTVIKKLYSSVDEKKFSIFASQVKKLYTKEIKLKAYWANKDQLGQEFCTCFRFQKGDLGDSAQNGLFVKINNRFRLLYITDENHRKHGRCIVYFKGGRQITMFNKYSKGLHNSKAIFMKALKLLLPEIELEEVVLKNSTKFNLPIYYCADGIGLRAKRYFKKTKENRFKCTYCGYRIKQSELESVFGEYSESTGCTKHDAKLMLVDNCDRCHEKVFVYDLLKLNENLYCYNCIKEEQYLFPKVKYLK